MSPLSSPSLVAGGRMALPRSTFVRHHLLLPAIATLLASMVLMGAGVDFWIADRLYALQGHHWALQDAWMTSRVLHKGGRNASCLLGLAAMVACLYAWRQPRWAALRLPLLYLVLAVALSTGLVSLLKSLSNMDCPWDLLRYGGDRTFVGLFSARPEGMPRGVCFPGGHASAGYAWVALYFTALLWRPRWALPGLAFGLLAGLLFGITQQLRGAHFLSHDVWTLAICWFTALALYLPFERRHHAGRVAAREALA